MSVAIVIDFNWSYYICLDKAETLKSETHKWARQQRTISPCLVVALKCVLFVHMRRLTMLHCLQEIRHKTKIDLKFTIYLFRIVGSCDRHRHMVVSTTKSPYSEYFSIESTFAKELINSHRGIILFHLYKWYRSRWTDKNIHVAPLHPATITGTWYITLTGRLKKHPLTIM